MHYQILSRLGEGGFSEVFEVRDPASALDEVLILKRLHAEMSRRPDVRRAFTQEGEILSSLRHPNVVTFRRCYYDGDHICLVMERVEGETLDVWLRKTLRERSAQGSGPGRAAEQVLDVFRQILEAVDHLHHRTTPLLHLDLKPENILIRPAPGDGRAAGVRPVLIDFGIARGLGHGGLGAYTPPYAAPEQVRGEPVGCAADVHALGQILAEILAAIGAAIGTEPPDVPSGPREGGGRERLGAVAARARNPSPRRRYADAGEMLRAFRRARHRQRSGTGSSAPRSGLPGGSAPAELLGRVRGRLRDLGGLGVAGVSALALAAFLGAGLILGSILLGSPPEPGESAGAAARGADPAPSASPGGADDCWAAAADGADPEGAGGPEGPQAVLRRFDRCARIALDGTSRRQIVAEYTAAKAFVRDRSSELDAEARDDLRERLETFRRTVDSRIGAGR